MESIEDKISKINSPILKQTAKMLIGVLNDIVDGNCEETDISDVLSKISPTSNGFIREDDYCNTEQAMEILGLGKNRNKFFNLVKLYKIENHRINNKPVGFLRSDIYRLRSKMK